MNQRLLERLKRHGEFPQLRPSAAALRQGGSVEPFTLSQPRLALSKQSSANAGSFNSPPSLQSALPTRSASFPEPNFSQSPQTTQVEPLSDAAQGDGAVPENFAAADRSEFFESPFSLNAQTAPTTNTEATINAPLNPAPDTAPSPVANLALSVNPSANQLEPALTARNPRADPRIAEPRLDAQPIAPTLIPIQTPSIAATTPNTLETQPSAPTVNITAVRADLVSVVPDTGAQPRTVETVPSASFAPQETAEFGTSDANFSVLPPDVSSNASSVESAFQADPEAAFAPAASATDFDRRAAMLELRDLGVKVRVTLSNAALKAQLEAVRTPAQDGGRSISPASTLETRLEPDTDATPNTGELRAQPNPNTEDASRALIAAVDLPAIPSIGAKTAEPTRLEPAIFKPVSRSPALDEAQSRPESPNAFPAVPTTQAVDASVATSAPATSVQSTSAPATARKPPPSVEDSQPLGANQIEADQIEIKQPIEIMAVNGAEPAVYGTVAAVEVYNPPNRRAAISRPKVTEATKNEAEVLFSSLPDSKPLDWLSRLNSVQALDAGVLNASQVGPLPAQSSPALVGAPQGPARLSAQQPSAAQPSAAPTSAGRADAPLLANLEISGSPRSSSLESTQPIASAAPLRAPGQENLPAAALIAPQAGLARSAPTAPTTPTSTAMQRQAASEGNADVSQISAQKSVKTVAERATEPSNAILSNAAPDNPPQARTLRQSTDLETDGLEIAAVETSASRGSASSLRLEADGLEVGAAETLAPNEFSPLEEGGVVQSDARQSMPRTAIQNASDDRAFEVTSAQKAEPRDLPSSSAVLPIALPSSLLGRSTDATQPASNEPSLTAALVNPSAALSQKQSPALQSDPVAQGTVAAVEVYNPPNRRALITRPKVTEAPKNEAEVLFSSLPDSNPLEWFKRLNSVQALEDDSSSAPVLLQRGAPSATDAPQAIRPVADEPGLRDLLDLGSAGVSQDTAPVAPRTAQTVPELSGRTAATANPQRGSEPQMREPVDLNAALSAQPLPANAQIGGAHSAASLIAIPPSAAPLVATPPSAATVIAALPNPESTTRAAVQPVRLSSSAQRLIAPITGIDPSTVQIRRDAQSDALTKVYRADALTVNGTVLLSARLGAETPETLGVIAHELTHVARARQPRFVPPALISANGSSLPSLEGQGEESIALQVEGFTRALAQQGMALNNTPLNSARPANAVGAQGKSRSLESVPWGDGLLPAPWELADRLEALTNPGLADARRQSAQPAAQQSAYNSAFTRSEAPAFAGGSSTSSLPTPSSSSGNFGGIGNSNAPISVRAADQGRSVPTPAPQGPLPKSPEAAPKPASGAAPAPDLDDLARQVYAVLKRRLITERRRSS